jgi:outer membrane protein assembly factor BamB
MVRGLGTFVLVASVICAAALPAAGANWPVFGSDPARSGVDSSRPLLTARNVARLRARWQISLGAIADSTAILLEHIRSGGIPRTMLFQTATNGVTFGIDAASGRILWRFRTLVRSPEGGKFSPLAFLRNAVFGPHVTNSTPAADPSGRFIYAPGMDGFVHKLDSASGEEVRSRGFPVRITLIPETEKDASALNVANGRLYATTSGFNGDAPPYYGHVVSVRLSDGSTTVFNSLCSQDRGLPTASFCPQARSGIWSRGGAIVDPDAAMHGQIYVATGNGDFDGNAGGHDYGDSVLALSADLRARAGYYTPAGFRALEEGDTDLGSTSPALLPRQPASHTPLMLVQGGKDGVLRLVNRSPLPGVAGELQKVDLVGPLFSTPAVWTDRTNRPWIFVGFAKQVDAYRLVTDARGTSRLVRLWRAQVGETTGEGTSPVVSDGIVFDALDGAIFALDALTGHVLWSSALPSAGRTIGPVHWQSPIVVNGWVYCSDQDGHLTAYALR